MAPPAEIDDVLLAAERLLDEINLEFGYPLAPKQPIVNIPIAVEEDEDEPPRASVLGTPSIQTKEEMRSYKLRVPEQKTVWVETPIEVETTEMVGYPADLRTVESLTMSSSPGRRRAGGDRVPRRGTVVSSRRELCRI